MDSNDGEGGYADGGDDDHGDAGDEHPGAVFVSSVPTANPTSPSADSHAENLMDERAVCTRKW